MLHGSNLCTGIQAGAVWFTALNALSNEWISQAHFRNSSEACKSFLWMKWWFWQRNYSAVHFKHTDKWQRAKRWISALCTYQKPGNIALHELNFNTDQFANTHNRKPTQIQNSCSCIWKYGTHNVILFCLLNTFPGEKQKNNPMTAKLMTSAAIRFPGKHNFDIWLQKTNGNSCGIKRSRCKCM